MGAPHADPGPDRAPGRWRAVVLLAAAEFLGMSLWFAANAASPELRARWGLSAEAAGWLTAVVQLGFVAGTACAALLNLADVLSSRTFLSASALLAALANAALLFAPSFGAALASRFATGFFLAGVYPPGMKMAATWFKSQRGLAIGIVVGALATGKAIPYVVHVLGEAHLSFVVWSTSLGAAAAAGLIAVLYRDGPFPFVRPPFSWRLAGTVLRDRETWLAIAGYLGHMWELYAMWTWLPAFVAASLVARGAAGHSPAADLTAFGALAAGGLGCVWGGWAARRRGYAWVVTLSMIVSGTCSLAIGLLFGASLWLVVPAALVWGFFVVSDSAQFSALVTEVAPPHAVGTALTLQTSMGFLLTLATIELVPRIAQAFGWRWVFLVLALGPAFGIAAIARLRRV